MMHKHFKYCDLHNFHYEIGSGMDIPECTCKNKKPIISEDVWGKVRGRILAHTIRRRNEEETAWKKFKAEFDAILKEYGVTEDQYNEMKRNR